jgi:pSer/pThr/pTyr-binding forkhead associated (FHA) protein
MDWIAIGRARNNDLILRHQSVSKLHARIHTENEGGSAGTTDRGSHWLTDMKSTAGTIVNDAPLAPAKPQRISPGDEIRLGQVTCEFLDSSALYRRLKSMNR